MLDPDAATAAQGSKRRIATAAEEEADNTVKQSGFTQFLQQNLLPSHSFYRSVVLHIQKS
eukprot:4070421-Amphidinium_carterae.4